MARKQRQRRQHGVLRPYPRGGQWWVQVPKVGRRSLSLPIATTPREVAHRVAAERFAAGNLDHAATAQHREGRLSELLDRFTEEHRGRWSKRHAANVAYQLGPFDAALAEAGITRIEQITADALSRYVHARQAKGVSDATINRTIQVARALARWAARRDPPLCDEGALARWKNLREIARNRDPLIPCPAEWARVAQQLERDPTEASSPEDQQRIDANARGVALLVAVGVQTGLRIDELRHLRPEDIAPDAVHVRAHDGWRPKDREERDVPVPASVAALARELASWLARARGRNGQRLALGPNYLARHLERAWSAAKLPGEAPGMHDCRRTFATEMSRRPGVSLRDVQRLLGHADLETTQRYLGRYRSDDARPAVDMGMAAALAPRDEAKVVPLRGRK